MPNTKKQISRKQQGQESRERIMDATYQVIAEKGYAGTTLAAVTAVAGLPASSVYWHFENKDALLAEVLKQSYAQWRHAGPKWVPEEKDTNPDSFEELSRRAAEGFTSVPEFWSLGLVLSIQKQVVDPRARETFIDIRRHTQELVAEFWRQALPAPRLEAHPNAPGEIARAMMALGDGYLVAAQVDPLLTSEQASWEITACITGIVRCYQ